VFFSFSERITFDVKLNFSLHNKANSILGIIKRNFRYLSEESFVMLYKALVRSHLEYANAVWSPYKKCDIYVLEGVQRRATKLINSVTFLTHEKRLKKLELPTLKYHRARGDMIKVLRFCMVIMLILLTFLFCFMLMLLQGVTNTNCLSYQ